MSLPIPVMSASRAVLHKESRSRPTLEPVDAIEIPQTHPVRIIADIYEELRRKCEPQHLPAFDDLKPKLASELGDYCLVLRPIEAEPYIDFLVVHRGAKIPGVELASVAAGERYTEHVLPSLAEERLMELASCLALKKSRLSLAHSARQSSLTVKVYRAVFPVWHAEVQQYAVVLAIAPVYTKVAEDAAN